ncbi:MAG: matrixin family metalloprotease [Saprospiraceae bacterium]|nr:matrixin family metalloprotease [Saprospiraceae bacterium]
MSIKVRYPKRNLGDYIVNNVKIEAQKSTILLDNIYELNLSDFTDTIVDIKIHSDCIFPSTRSTYYELDTIFENLIAVTLKVSNWGLLGDLTIEDFQLEGTAKYINETEDCQEFDDLCVENGSFQLGFCDIFQTITAHFGAGIQQEITFKGLNYGFSGKIEIPNADDGGASSITINSNDTRWIKLWSDTEIKVLISSIAPDHPMGSGKWKIKPIINSGCEKDIEIDYAISNTFSASNTERMNSIATSPFAGNDKFKWYIDKTAIETNSFLISQGISYTDVFNVCYQAFCDWEQACGLEFSFEGENVNGNNATDQKYTVTIGDLGGSILANTPTRLSITSCDPSNNAYIDRRLFDSDIIIDENQPWYVSLNPTVQSAKFDLYSVMIHEIGHLLLMKHANQGTMFFMTPSGSNVRSIDSKLLNGIEVQKNRTLNAIGDCLAGFALNTSVAGCTTSTKDDLNINENRIYPNLFYSGAIIQINFEKEFEEIEIYDLKSRLVYQSKTKSRTLFLMTCKQASI